MSWLNDYLEYTRDQEAPEIFHLWTGITIIASALGRSVWMDRRSQGVTRYRIYPGQIMTVLVGDSGTRKTTAIEIGRTFMQKVGVNLISGKMSAEKMLDKLAQSGTKTTGSKTTQGDSVATFYASELSVFLSKATYAEPMIDLLMELADAKDEFKMAFRGTGEVSITNPCVTLLAAATPISIGESIPPKSHSNGWLARVAHVYSADSGKIDPLIDLDDSEVSPEKKLRIQELGNSLIDRLHAFRMLRGPISFTPDGREWFREWYHTFRTSIEGKMEGWPSKRHDWLLRVANILRVSHHEDLLLDADALLAAHLALAQVEQGFEKAFAFVGRGQIAKDEERTVAFIKKSGGRVTTHVLIRYMYRYFHNMEETRTSLMSLLEAGIIRRSQEGPVEYWYVVDE